MDLYTTYQLLMVVRVQKSLPKFWINFFGRSFYSTTDMIAIDKVSNTYRRLAPLVAPNVQGRVLKKRGHTTTAVSPAYVKPKHIVDPSVDFTRQPGEALATGSLSDAQRRQRVVTELLQVQRNMIDNFVEWMCARAAIDGAVTLSSPDYPTQTVDFQRDASLTYTLTSTARWGEVDATPLANIMAGRLNVNTRVGANIQTVIFGQNAWANFYAKEIAGKEEKLLKQDVRGSKTDISFLANGFEGMEDMGWFLGSNGAGFRCVVYTAKYEDENGALQDMMSTDSVVGIAPGEFDGVEAYGKIRDKRANYEAMKYFPKNWEEQDPSIEYLMTQSAPLMIPGQPNATFHIKTRG